MRKLKKHLMTVGIIVVFLVGFSVLMYPAVADYMNSISQSKVVSQYYANLEKLTEEDFHELFEAARLYNRRLPHKSNRFVLSDEEMLEYRSLLNPGMNGVMGTLVIDAIRVKLPIYHGTDEGVLQVGAGHFEGTSLPVGGLGTHSVITGHRGLPSSTLLTNLNKLAVGDTFEPHILNEVLTYQVDQILVVLPNETEALYIDPNKDYCTLITCTPYGVNSHRMLVRGQRTDNIEHDVEKVQLYRVSADATPINAISVAVMVFLPVLFAVMIYLAIRLLKIHRGRRRINN